MIFLDTETCGFHGFPVLFQWAEDDSEIKLWDVWKQPICETLDLVLGWMDKPICGFNLAFDAFHLIKLVTTFSLYHNQNEIPEDIIDDLAVLESEARFGDCLKPKSACDVMLWARKGPYQSLMARDDIRVRRVPAALAYALAQELERRVQLDNIYFARRKDKFAPRWQIKDTDDTGFKDVVLVFAPSGQLKTIALHAGVAKEDELLRYGDIEIAKEWRPTELGYAPFALAIGKPGRWNGAWPQVIDRHIAHWRYHTIARRYAGDDVKYTRGLWHHFGRPEPGDDDSCLAWMVAAVRWRGFKIDVDKMKEQKRKALARVKSVPVAPKQALIYLREVLSPQEQLTLGKTTKKNVLEDLWNKSKCDCTFTVLRPDCKICSGSGRHPVAVRAKQVLDARKGIKEAELYDKLIATGRFHPSLKVIGTLSSRMAGADGLNPQGINRKDEVRACFTFADLGFDFCGGDFDSFEVTLADAIYECPKLRTALKSGKKFHTLFGVLMYPGKSEEEIAASKGKEPDMYSTSKSGAFLKLFGGTWHTMVQRLGIDELVAQEAERRWDAEYPEIKEANKELEEMYCAVRQPGGLRTEVKWHPPHESVDNLMGFKRYFTLEYRIMKALFDLASNPPSAWQAIKLRVVRRDREQFVGGATRSALFAACFGMQGRILRAAGNHRIQSRGATITKRLQRRIWDIQPVGFSAFRVVPLNIHDEVLTNVKPEFSKQVQDIAYATVAEFKKQVPLLSMEWKLGMKNWSEK